METLFDLVSEVQHDAKHLDTFNTSGLISADIMNPPTEGKHCLLHQSCTEVFTEGKERRGDRCT